MEKDIIIQEDNYTGTRNKKYQQVGQEIDDIVAEYTRIIKSLTDGRLKGETAQKLSGFAQETSRLLKGMMEPAMTECAEKQVKFVGEIEVEDQ